MQNTAKDLFLDSNPEFPHALSPWFSHEYINYYTISAVDKIQELPPIETQSNPNYDDWSIGPNHIDLYKEIYQEKRNIPNIEGMDPLIRNSDFGTEPPKEEVKTTAYKVLILYCTEPDLHLDVGLKLSNLQILTAGSHGFRHMKFRAFGVNLGAADKCLDYYLKAAKRAFRDHNDYWGWRFLARATHYAADMCHPFHVKIAPFFDMFKILGNYHKFLKFVSATHTGHEMYVTQRFRENFLPFKEALQQGSIDAMDSEINWRNKLIQCRKYASKQLKPLHKTLLKYFGDDLIKAYNVMDEHHDLDISKQTTFAKKESLQVLFKNPDNPGLKIMDEITSKLLYNVGFLISLLIKDFI